MQRSIFINSKYSLQLWAQNDVQQLLLPRTAATSVSRKHAYMQNAYVFDSALIEKAISCSGHEAYAGLTRLEVVVLLVLLEKTLASVQEIAARVGCEQVFISNALHILRFLPPRKNPPFLITKTKNMFTVFPASAGGARQRVADMQGTAASAARQIVADNDPPGEQA